MQNPLMGKVKWSVKSRLPGVSSQNTWNAMKLIDKGLQPPTQKQDKDKPPILADESINPYIRRAIEKRIMKTSETVSDGQIPVLAQPLQPEQQVPALAQPPQQGQYDWRQTVGQMMPYVQNFVQQMHPMNQFMSQANQFVQSGPGQMMMGMLPA
jgi:hypothetical protein